MDKIKWIINRYILDRDIYNRAVEKFDKRQLKRKQFEIYQTISCIEAFLLSFFLNICTKFVSKLLKLAAVLEIVVESILKSVCQPQKQKFIPAPL